MKKSKWKLTFLGKLTIAIRHISQMTKRTTQNIGYHGYRMNFFFFIPLSFAATKERGKEKWLLRRHECHPLCPPSNSCGKSKLDADTLLHAAIGGRPFTSRPHRMSALPAHIRQWADVVMSLHVAIVYRPQVCGSR